MRSLAALAATLLALAACESDGGEPPAPPAPPSGPYERQTTTDDLTVRILIPEAARVLPVAGERLVAESEAEAAELARRAAERRREGGGGGFIPSELILAWSVAWRDADAMSLVRRTRTFEGGFTTEESLGSLLVDRTTGREIAFADLFSDPRPNGAAMSAVSDAAFAAWVETSPVVGGRDLALVDEYLVVDVRETLRPRASSFQTFAVVPGQDDALRVAGLELIYQPGMLGPATDGPFTLFVPASVLAPHLAPEWAARLTVASSAEPVENLNSAP